MAKISMDDTLSAEFASTLREKSLVLTVHGKLPASHSAADIDFFRQTIDPIAKWQAKYGLLTILSFDVPQEVRDNVLPYIQYVLAYEQFGKIAVEDFGLTEAERTQIEPLKGNDRFGYLIDIGHMMIRLKGRSKEPITLFTNSPEERPQTDHPGFPEFLKAFRSKTFPVFEIHLHNNDGISDLHAFLEDGAVDIRIIADILKQLHYDGIVTIESVPRLQGCFYPESDERIVKTLEFWKSCIR